MRRLIEHQPERQGQATVEFAIAVLVVLAVILGGIEVSRAIYVRHATARAAEAIVRELTQIPRPGDVDSGKAQQAIVDAQKVSGVSLNSSTFSIVVGKIAADGTCSTSGSGATCQAFVFPQVTIIGLSTLDNSPNSLKVIVTQNYQSATRLFNGFLGGRVQETATDLTQNAQNPIP